MKLSTLGVRATSGTLRLDEGFVLQHVWTDAGVMDGGFDDAWHSTGIEYTVTLDARASAQELARLHAKVDEVAEIPRAIREGARVTRVTESQEG